MIKDTSKTSSRSDIALAAIAAVGIILRVIQYLERHALWLDEAMLSVSIVKRHMRALIFSPLEFNQNAPPLYLQLAKISTLLFGPTEFALRLPSLLFSIGSMLLFIWIARRVLDKAGALIASGLFAIAPLPVIYASEAKQYAGDLFAASLLTAVAIKLYDSGFARRWIVVTGLSALGLVWLSDTSLLVLGGVGVSLMYFAIRDRNPVALWAAKFIGPVWLVASIAVVAGMHRRLNNETGRMLHSAWSGAFMPLPPRNVDQFTWLPHTTNRFFVDDFGVRSLGGLVVVTALIGVWRLWKSQRRLTMLCLSPVVMGLIASALRMYPWAGGRASLYLTIPFALALGAGIVYAGNLLPSHKWLPQAALFLAFINPPEFLLKGFSPPWLNEPIEPALAYVQANRKPGDRIYVYWGAVPATMFYGPRFGISQSEYVSGGIYGKNWDQYASELAQFSGSPRVWVIFSHTRTSEREQIMHQMDSLGVQQTGMAFPHPGLTKPNVSVALYDLSGKSAKP